MKTRIFTKKFCILSFLILILSSNTSLAIEKNKNVHDENGLEIIITCITNSTFFYTNFLLNLSIELSNQPDNVVKLIEIDMNIRLVDTRSKAHASKTISFPHLIENEIREKSIIINYNSSWGKVRLELELLFTVEKIDPLPSVIMTTGWLSFFTIRPNSFFSNFYWIFIVFSLIIFIVIIFIFKKKDSKSKQL